MALAGLHFLVLLILKSAFPTRFTHLFNFPLFYTKSMSFEYDSKTMGIDYDSRLIIGWRVDRKAAQTYAATRCACRCEQPTCSFGDCWDPERLELPPHFIFKSCRPFFHCNQRDIQVYLSLHREVIALTELQEISQIDWDAGRKLAVSLGADDCEACLFSAPTFG